MGDAVIGRLYAACYEEGQNVSLRSTVARIAAEVGVPGGEAFVMSNERLDQLQEALDRPVRHLPPSAAPCRSHLAVPTRAAPRARGRAQIANGKRVRAAPTFSLRVGDTPAASFSGAQEAEQWVSILEQLADYTESMAARNTRVE